VIFRQREKIQDSGEQGPIVTTVAHRGRSYGSGEYQVSHHNIYDIHACLQ
jgi:hypothetical protein